LWIAEKIGLGTSLLGPGLVDRLLPKSLKLDGLLSVWQASPGGNDDPSPGADK
jgi:hypothetical protein